MVGLLTLKSKLKAHSQCCFPVPTLYPERYIRKRFFLIGFVEEVAFGQGLEKGCIWIGREALEGQ